MTLSGNLGFVKIDEVLRLLTRSHQQGSVAVTGLGLRGRVFVGKGGIDLATTLDNDELHRHLVNSGYADEKSLNRIVNGETTLAAVAEANAELVDLLREMTVESLYQMATLGEEFVVHEGATSSYASPKSFELEHLIRDAEERKREWYEVSEVIPDLDGALVLSSELGDRDEVTIKTDDWRVLSAIGSGSSVQTIADRLGTTQFWTARVAARLANQALVDLAFDDELDDDTEDRTDVPAAVVEHDSPGENYSVYEEESPGIEESRYEERDEYKPVESAVSESSDEVSDEPDSDQTWWQEPEPEPVADQADEDEDEDARTPAVVSEGLSEIPPIGTREEESEEDTQTFLQKVFSELESSEDETDEGHGLLRRRRMGTLRDFSSDS